MKKILISFIFLFTILLTGCSKEGNINVNFTCNGITKEVNVGVNDVFKCTLMGKNYEMKITSIDDNGFTINSNYELSYVENNEIDANSTLKEFHIRKDGKTDLAVPMDGLAFKISFEY